MSYVENKTTIYSDASKKHRENKYLPSLDGLRAISILLVIISHAGLGNIIPGGLGVIVFFVISGFLITKQMIDEVDSSGTLSLSGFYMRRVFRLMPALLFYLAVFVPILTIMGATITLTHVASGLFYFANYYDIFIGYSEMSPMPILWSLSVEEHYYIVFPFIILMSAKNIKKLLPWLMVVVVIALIWKILLYSACQSDSGLGICGLPDSKRWKGTDEMFDCILFGAITAIALRYYKDITTKILINRTAFALAIAGILLTLIIRNPEFRGTIRYSLQSIFSAIIIINVLFGDVNFIRGILSCQVAVYIGRISYSLYLAHFGVLTVIVGCVGKDVDLHHNFLMYFILSFLGASISYFFVEKPMIKVRRMFGSSVRPIGERQ